LVVVPKKTRRSASDMAQRVNVAVIGVVTQSHITREFLAEIERWSCAFSSLGGGSRSSSIRCATELGVPRSRVGDSYPCFHFL
jgi:hypothetical protein